MKGLLQTELPFWLALIGLMLAIFLSWYAYAGQKNSELFSKFQRYFLGAIRGLGIFVIVLLVIGIYFKSSDRSKLDQGYLLAFDNSESMLLGTDSLELSSMLKNYKEQAVRYLDSEFQLDTFQFGGTLDDECDLTFKEQSTNFDRSLRQLLLDNSNRPIKELLIVTDGIPTSGTSLRSTLSKFPHPVSVIAVGDTLTGVDTRIEEVNVTDIAFYKSVFPVEFLVSSHNTSARSLKLTLSYQEDVIVDTLVKLDSLDGRGMIKLDIPAMEPGVVIFESFLTPINGEINIINNRKSFVVEFVEKKNKILLVYDQPHPDISVFSEIIKSTGDYELDLWPVSKGNPDLISYSSIILYQFPSSSSSHESLMQQIADSDISTFFIVGPKSSLKKINTYFPEISFSSNRTLFEDYGAHLNSQFDLFHLPEDFNQYIEILPPLKGHYSKVSMTSSYNIVLNQTVMGIELEDPLLWFTRSSAKKVGFWWGEGIWRWNTFEYLYFEDHYFTESLVRSILAYLSIDDVSDPLKIDVPSVVGEHEEVVWNARLYNESFELTTDPVLYMEIKSPAGELRKYEFRKRDDKYWMRLDNLIGGTYEYKCFTTNSDANISKSGTIEVLETPLEGIDRRARILELQAIANQKGGQFFRVGQKNEIEEYLKSLKSEESSEYNITSWVNLLDWHVLLFILIGIFAVEWILRRFLGTR